MLKHVSFHSVRKAPAALESPMSVFYRNSHYCDMGEIQPPPGPDRLSKGWEALNPRSG